MKISFITTVLNEEKTIEMFLKSLSEQTKKPDEIIIVDGGSTDATASIISNFQFPISNKKIKTIIKKGNRSVGRNYAIEHANGNIIAVSDVGCILDKNWLRNIAQPFENKKIDVVAGFYKPLTHSVFEKCLATYTCTMPDKIDPERFLPSSRSVAFKKSAWIKVDGYPKKLDTCEDLVFDKKLKEAGLKFVFAKNAIVWWPQRKNIFAAFGQFLSYAKGDGQALYIRSQTPLLFLRYIIGFVFLLLYIQMRSYIILNTLYLILIAYVLWSILKNYKYIRHPKAFIYLPLLQYISDIAVISGFLVGLISRN